MAIETRTRLSHIEIDGNGHIGVKVYKEAVDGDKVLFSEPHRSAIAPDVTVDEQIDAVNAHLEAMGYPPVSKEHLDLMKRHADIVPERAVALAARRERERVNEGAVQGSTASWTAVQTSA